MLTPRMESLPSKRSGCTDSAILSQPKMNEQDMIIIYDGRCAGCSRFISFILPRLGIRHSWLVVDQWSQDWMNQVGIEETGFIRSHINKSIIVVERNKSIHIRSSAIREIMSDCDGFIARLIKSGLRTMPTRISDSIYVIIACARRLTYKRSAAACSVQNKELVVRRTQHSFEEVND